MSSITAQSQRSTHIGNESEVTEVVQKLVAAVESNALIHLTHVGTTEPHCFIVTRDKTGKRFRIVVEQLPDELKE